MSHWRSTFLLRAARSLPVGHIHLTPYCSLTVHEAVQRALCQRVCIKWPRTHLKLSRSRLLLSRRTLSKSLL
jgi:hypothetical protein